MNELRFSYNWNGKLNCNSFTTIRLKNDQKYFVGQELNVYLGKSLFGFYKIQSVKIIKLNQINDWIAYLDTGYDAEKTKNIVKEMYKNKPSINVETADFHYILLTRIQ